MESLRFTPYVIPSLGSAVICLLLARYAWQRRPTLGTTAFSWMMLAIALWSLLYALELSTVSLADKRLWAKLQYGPIAAIPALWFVLSLEYNGRDNLYSWRNFLLLAIFPLITVALTITNESHQLIWQSVALNPAPPLISLDITYGSWFWLHIFYSYALILAGSFSFISSLRSAILPLYRWQIVMLLVGVLAPWVAYGIYISEADPFPNLDLISIGFMVSSLTIAIGILRYRLFDIVPVARQGVIDSMREGMIVLDLYNRIVDINQAGSRILNIKPAQAIGNHAADIISDNRLARHIRLIKGEEVIVAELTIGAGIERRYYEVQLSPLFEGNRKRLQGRLLVLHNVTRQKTAEAALLNQKQLFQNLVAVARATAERPTLEATLQNALDVAVKLTKAELGSLFVLDDNNTVTHSILSRGETPPLEQQELIGRVMDQGLAGWVFRHKEAALVFDTVDDKRWITFPDAPYIARSVLVVPILGGETVLGTLTLQHSAPHHFSTEELKLMQAAADQIALALRNARIYDGQRRLAQQQTALYETLKTVGGHLQPGTVIHAAAGTVAAVTGWTAVAILLPNESKTSLKVQAASGILSAAEGLQIPIDKSVCGQVFTEGQTIYVPDISKRVNYVSGHEAIKSELAVPIQRGEQMLGILDVESDQLDGFQDEDIRLAESLAETIGLALDNAQLFRVIEDERSRLQALIQSNRDGVILVGIDQQILVMNQPAHELLRLPDTPADWVNRSVMAALAELFEYAPLAAQATMGGMRYMNQGTDPPSAGEIEVEPRTLRWHNLPVKVGDKPIGRLLSLHDITDERLLEQTRNDLTHMMVHDLRNPLNNIYGAQKLLVDLGSLNDEQIQVLEVAMASTQRMVDLVKEILDISRLESGHMPLEREPISIDNIIQQTLESQRPQATSKDIRLTSEIPPDLSPVSADRSLIERVLQNLVGNALKFTPLGGTVLITAGQDVEAQNQLFIRVQDTGPGIPKDVQDRIFQKFTTGNQTGSGSGLGLAFSKMVVEAHNGRIWAKSWPDQGATFTFTLPTATTTESTMSPQSEVPLFQTYNRPKMQQ